MGADVNPELAGKQAQRRSLTGGAAAGRKDQSISRAPATQLLDAEPALGALAGLNQQGLPVLVFEHVLGTHQLAHASAFAQFVVDAYAHGYLPSRRGRTPGNLGRGSTAGKIGVG